MGQLLRNNIERDSTYITAAFLLHNKAMELNDGVDEFEDDPDNELDRPQPHVLAGVADPMLRRRGQAKRLQMIDFLKA